MGVSSSITCVHCACLSDFPPFSHFPVITTDEKNILYFLLRKPAHMSEERIEMVKTLSKKSDIYERLARAIGKLTFFAESKFFHDCHCGAQNQIANPSNSP